MALKLRKLSYPLGVEVCDINVAKDVSERSFGEIYRAFLDHGILLFRNQDITREQHVEFSRRFGELDRHDSLPRDRRKDFPELLMVTNEPKPDGSPSDTVYHASGSFQLMVPIEQQRGLVERLAQGWTERGYAVTPVTTFPDGGARVSGVTPDEFSVDMTLGSGQPPAMVLLVVTACYERG